MEVFAREGYHAAHMDAIAAAAAVAALRPRSVGAVDVGAAGSRR